MRESRKKKIEYFWMYYKIPFLIITGICAVVFYFGYAKLTEKEVGFQAILFDIHTDVTDAALEKEFAEYAGIDPKKEDVLISTSLLLSDAASDYAMTSQAKFYSLIGIKELDVGMMYEENFRNYAKADAFLDLREVFTEEELEAFPDLYLDESGKAIGIYGNGLPKIRELSGYEENTAVIGIIYNSQHVETARDFLYYLSNEGE